MATHHGELIPRLYKVYTEHRSKRVRRTKSMFESAEIDHCSPPVMHLLHTDTMTQRQAFRHCVAWMKYFVQHG